MNKHTKGTISLFGAVLIWGSAFIAQSVGMDLIGPFTFQFFRCALAVVFLAAVCLFRDVRKGGMTEFRKKWQSRELRKAGIICGCALFVAASLQQIGLVYTDAGKAGFITAMYIVLVPVLGLFLGRKPSRATLFSLLPATGGLYLLSCVGVTEINKGDLCLIGCALAYAVQISCIDHFAPEADGLRMNCIQGLVVTLLSIPFMILTETVDMGNILACALPIGYAGILSMGVAYTLQIIGQRYVEPTAASLIMSLESVVAVICGAILLHERMSGWELLGCALVFGAVVISQIPQKSNIPK